jgi:hypothetical protein
VPTALRVGIRDQGVRRGADDRRAVASQDLIERGDELAGAVADQEPDGSLVSHREVSGCLGRPGADRVGRDAGEVHAACVHLDEEQHVQPANSTVSTVKKSHATIPAA